MFKENYKLRPNFKLITLLFWGLISSNSFAYIVSAYYLIKDNKKVLIIGDQNQGDTPEVIEENLKDAALLDLVIDQISQSNICTEWLTETNPIFLKRLDKLLNAAYPDIFNMMYSCQNYQLDLIYATSLFLQKNAKKFKHCVLVPADIKEAKLGELQVYFENLANAQDRKEFARLESNIKEAFSVYEALTAKLSKQVAALALNDFATYFVNDLLLQLQDEYKRMKAILEKNNFVNNNCLKKIYFKKKNQFAFIQNWSQFNILTNLGFFIEVANSLTKFNQIIIVVNPERAKVLSNMVECFGFKGAVCHRGGTFKDSKVFDCESICPELTILKQWLFGQIFAQNKSSEVVSQNTPSVTPRASEIKESKHNNCGEFDSSNKLQSRFDFTSVLPTARVSTAAAAVYDSVTTNSTFVRAKSFLTANAPNLTRSSDDAKSALYTLMSDKPKLFGHSRTMSLPLQVCSKEPVKAVIISEITVQKLCINADCLNEAQLQCTRCKLAQYCSESCQVANWPEHKTRCKQNNLSSEQKTN